MIPFVIHSSCSEIVSSFNEKGGLGRLIDESGEGVGVEASSSGKRL